MGFEASLALCVFDSDGHEAAGINRPVSVGCNLDEDAL